MSAGELQPFSPEVEDYVKTIYKMQQDEQAVTTTGVAKILGKSPSAASKMFKYLSEMRLVDHTRYQGVQLTPTGEKVALEIIRHHRLLELYLHQALGYSWDTVDAEAEKLEHHISEDFEDKIDRLLDFPLHDPHGDPIPTRDGTIAPLRGKPLSQSQPEERVVIMRVRDSSPEALRYLAHIGMKLGAKIEIKAREPFGGTLQLEVDGVPHSVGKDLAEFVFVEECTEAGVSS